jgi:metallo-beta-lactamase family protein
MKITFHGAAHTVTGSQHLFEINGKLLLLECGLYQGRRNDAFTKNTILPFDPKRIDAVILSHAHIDHCGNLPNLVKNGYAGPIHTTTATVELAAIVLADSGHIQEADAAFLNKRNAERGKPAVEPLYTIADAEAASRQLVGHRYDEPFFVMDGVQVTLFDAGHILGSAGILLDIEETGKHWRVIFSGDIGRRGIPILSDPVLPQPADLVLMECTYGDKPHRDHFKAEMELRDTVLRTVERRGKVIVPSFALGRTQELVYSLGRMIEQHEIPQLPIIVDSPLAVSISDMYKKYPEYFDKDAERLIAKEGEERALGYQYVTFTRSVEESKALNKRTESMIILSASGMAETGRIRHHLLNNIGDERNTIMIVSWQAPDTLGRLLADKIKTVKIFGEPVERKAEVVTIGGFSAHAGQDFLLDYAKACASSAKALYLIHGEAKSVVPFQEALKTNGVTTPTFYPQIGEQAEYI